jgi:GT2 family glycosyltransferase
MYTQYQLNLKMLHKKWYTIISKSGILYYTYYIYIYIINTAHSINKYISKLNIQLVKNTTCIFNKFIVLFITSDRKSTKWCNNRCKITFN